MRLRRAILSTVASIVATAALIFVAAWLIFGTGHSQADNAEFVTDVRNDPDIELPAGASDSEILDMGDQVCEDIDEVGADRYFDSVSEEMYADFDLAAVGSSLALADLAIDQRC